MTSTNDGKDVISNQTSGPKGKSYYIELYKSLEARLSECTDAGERTRHLCAAWRSVRQVCLHAAPSTQNHLLTWIQRHTARTVLQTEWQSPKRKDERESLERAIDACLAECGSEGWERQLAARADCNKRLLQRPWDHPVLAALLNPAGAPPEDDDVVSWLSSERGVTLVARLHALAGERCDDLAATLATALMERARRPAPHTEGSAEDAQPSFAARLKDEAGFTTDVWETLTDIELVLLHKRDSQRCIALAKQTPLGEAQQLIQRLQGRLERAPRDRRLWKNAREVAVLVAQVVIARCMMDKECSEAGRKALYCCARLLARLLAARLPAAADALAAQAPTARHLHALALAANKELAATHEKMKPYVCELYVRALTAGMNELERLKLKTEQSDQEEARVMEQTLASWFEQLGGVLGSSARLACECTLTAFSLHPTRHMVQRLHAAPALPSLRADSNDSKEEAVQSDFGSWACDSRSQTNLVKTSETLKLKQSQHQANVLSTAIFNEGESLGLGPELCQDLAVLLAGPRVKTLSWDMDRAALLESCRAYSEQTQGGTRALTRELKYLNIDPRHYLHLPEEADDDENDPYYGIERGYEHLAVLDEPEDMWNDDNDPSKTETASSVDDDFLNPRRKKFSKKVIISSDEDEDPLSYVAEAKRTQKKKERPHSKERKERKKKQVLVDPLDIEGTSQPILIPQKEKKQRKKKEKVPKVIGSKKSSLASLVGIKVGKSRKKSNIATVTTSVAKRQDRQEKNSLTSLNSVGSDSDASVARTISAPVRNSQLRPEGTLKSDSRLPYSMMGQIPQINQARMLAHQNTVRLPSSTDYNKAIDSFKRFPEEVRANLTRLLDIRQKEKDLLQQRSLQLAPPRKPAIVTPNIPLQSHITPKSVTIPEIPKSYINKEQAERMAQLSPAQMKDLNSVIQFARKPDVHKTTPTASSSQARNKQTSSVKMSDIINPTFDRLLAEITERQRGLEMKTAQSQYQPPLPRPVPSLNVTTPGQRDFQNFLKEYEAKKYTNPQVVNLATKHARDNKKPVMPVSRVIPVVPTVQKPEPKPFQCGKQTTQIKKPEPSLNTFSRLCYHKNKQNELKNRAQNAKAACGTTTYQEISTELDQIIHDHQREQIKVIQTKRDFDRYKPTNVQETKKNDSVAKGHPYLSSLLQQTNLGSSTQYRNDSAAKVSPTQQSPPKSYHMDKDLDLMNLLRQQNTLNNNSRYYSTNMNSKPSTSMSKVLPVSNYNPPTQPQQHTGKPATQDTKKYSSPVENKTINIISNTQIKPANQEINNSIGLNHKSNLSTPKIVKEDVSNQLTAKNTDKPEWQIVMSNLLKHKTPTRVTNAFDVTPNKTSFETAFEKSLKKPSVFEKNLSETSTVSHTEQKMVPMSHHERSDCKTPVVTYDPNLVITKKVIKSNTEVPKQNLPTDSKIFTNPNLKVQNDSTEMKKLSQENQRKHFTYPGPKNMDPLISGIPNSDYDLLEELMDDDLRKEIGELSSDEESYNAAAQSFFKSTKSGDKRVNVQFNKSDNGTISNRAANAQHFNDLSRKEISQSQLQKSGSQGGSDGIPTPHQNNTLQTHQKPMQKTRNNKFNYKTSTSLCPKTQLSTSVASNQTSNNANISNNNHVVAEPCVYITTVTRPAPVQNVVLIGQDVVYGGYTTVQAPVQALNEITPNTYIALNSTPVTLYQQYTAPVVMRTEVTTPVINNVSCAHIPVQTGSVDITRPHYPTPLEQQSTVAEPNDNVDGSDTLTNIVNQHVIEGIQQNQTSKQEEKPNERKVLCEVQDFVLSENIDKTRNQKVENNFDLNIKKNSIADMERVKNKRLAIINREIYHRCGEKIIPLTYSPLPVKMKTVLEHDLSKTIPLHYNALTPKDDKQKLSDSEEEKLLAQIKNNLEDLSDCINEVKSPATPDSNDSKENKSYSEVPLRRILLRSSNKGTSKMETEKRMPELPKSKKSRAKTKSQVSDCATKTNVDNNNCKNDNIEEKQVGTTKRASKRLRNIKPVLDDIMPVESNAKTIAKPVSNTCKMPINTENNHFEYMDIESEIQGSKICKLICNENNGETLIKSTNREMLPKASDNIVLDDCTLQIIQPCEEKTSQNLVIYAHKENETAQKVAVENLHTNLNQDKRNDTSEVSLLQTDSLVNSQNIVARVENLNEEPIFETSLSNETSEQLAQSAVIDQIMPELRSIDENIVPENVTQLENVTADEKPINQNIPEITINEKVVPENSTHLKDVVSNENLSQSRVIETDNGNDSSKPTYVGLEENIMFSKKLPLHDIVESIKVKAVTTSPAEVLATCKDKSSKEKSISLEDQRKDNIDLDMSVTCEEGPKLSPKFENIKTARRKRIDIDTKNQEVRNDVNMISHTNKTRKNSKDLTSFHEVGAPKQTETVIETLKPSPESSLVNEVQPVTSTVVDNDDDVVIIDDSPTKKQEIPRSANTEAPLLKQNSEKNRANVDNFVHGKKSVKSLSNAFSTCDPNKMQTNNMQPDIPDSIKDKIQIEYLPTNDPLKVVVRVSLPNGRKVLATVQGRVHVTLDTLFTYPSIREALMSGMESRKLLTLSIEQLATVDKNNPNRILSAEILKMETPETISKKPVETINLLSDDDEDGSAPEVNSVKNVFETEFGKFTVPHLDNDLFTKHQNKFSQKSQVLLKRVDIKSDRQVQKSGNISSKDIEKMDVSPFIPKQYVTGLIKDIENLTSELKPTMVPEVVEIDDSSNDSLFQGTSSESTKGNAINDLKNVLLKELGVEEQAVTGKINLTDDDVEIVNKIPPPKQDNQTKINKRSSIPCGESCRFDDLNEEQQQQITMRKCKIKLVRCDEAVKENRQLLITESKPLEKVFGDESVIIPEDFTIFNDLDEKAVREERSSSPVIELFDVCFTPLEKTIPGFCTSEPNRHTQICEASWHNNKSILHFQSVSNPKNMKSNTMTHDSNILDDGLIDKVTSRLCRVKYINTQITQYSETTNQDSTNLLSFINNDENMCDDTTIPIKYQHCEADWLKTKLLCTRDYNGSNLNCAHPFVSEDDFYKTPTDKPSLFSCEGDWHETKSTLYLQGVTNDAWKRCHVSENESNTLNDNEIANLKVDDIFMTESILESTKDNALVQVSDEQDCEMHEENLSNITMPLTCEAPWFTTKAMLQLKIMNFDALIRPQKLNENILTPRKRPLSCKANWLASKSDIHHQAVHYKLCEFNRNKICGKMSVCDMINLSCEAQWHTTKSTLHLEEIRNNSSQKPNVIINEENLKGVASISTLPIQVHSTNASSLLTLVLDSLQADVIQQYVLLRQVNKNSVNLLKRKATSQNFSVGKVFKSNEQTRTETIECKLLCSISSKSAENAEHVCSADLFQGKNIKSKDIEEVVQYHNKCNKRRQEDKVSNEDVLRDDEDDASITCINSKNTCSSLIITTNDLVAINNTYEEELLQNLIPDETCFENNYNLTQKKSENSNKTHDYVEDSYKYISSERITQSNTSLENNCMIVTGLQNIEPHVTKNSHDESEVNVSKSNDESLIFELNSKHSQTACELDMQSQKSKVIENDHQKYCPENMNVVHPRIKDHEYYIDFDAASGLVSDKISKNDCNDVCVPTNAVIYLLEDENTKEIEEEIVDMHDVEIVENYFGNVITPKQFDDSNQESKINTKCESAKKDNDISQCSTKDDVTNNSNREESDFKIFDNVSEDIAKKYLALIENKSKTDSEVGICYVIPVVDESSQTDIETINNFGNIGNIKSKIEKPVDTKTKALQVNCEIKQKDNKCRLEKDDKSYDFDDNSVKIVDESFKRIKTKLANTLAIRLEEKYETTYSVEVETISSPDNDPSQLWTTDQVRKNISEPTESMSCSSKRRRLTKYDSSEDVSIVPDTENLYVKPPKNTYARGVEQIKTRRKSLKRKVDMSETKTSDRKYRKAKHIDCPKFTAAALSETLYSKEYNNLINYYSSVKFSFSLSFHKDTIDVQSALESWPIQTTTHPLAIENTVDKNVVLFTEIEKTDTLLDPLDQTLSEEIISEFDESSYIPSNIKETNFNMGFGERSGRVIKDTRDGEFTTFSAATLSDVKPLQPLLPSDTKDTFVHSDSNNKNIEEQKLKARRYLNYWNMRERVRAFFEKTKAELNFDWRCYHKKDDFVNDVDRSSWPFGELTSTRCIRPSPLAVAVNVVQVGQLPVSAAAQNPVTCDPRVTHVSNASPSQCSPENSLGDELQTPIKTEYTELTTADITLPLMQEYVQHHSMPSETPEPPNLYASNDSAPISNQIKSVKIELTEETTQENEDNIHLENKSQQQQYNGNVNNNSQLQFENTASYAKPEMEHIAVVNSSKTPKQNIFRDDKQTNDIVEKSDQIAHAMSAAGISATRVFSKSNNTGDSIQQTAQPNVALSQANSNNFSKTTPINALALQQALAQILPPPLNPTNNTSDNPQTSSNPQVLHIMQGNNAQSVISKPNGTQLLHIVQNKGVATSNGSPASQQNAFSGLSLVDGAIQQSGNQLLHIVNTANQKNTSAGQLLKRVNLLTNLANVQGSNEQKMVQFVCKSADGKSIQLPHQRSMVLRLQPLDPPNVHTMPKQNDNQEHNLSSATTHNINEKEPSPQEMKSRSLYEENYAKFVQNDSKFAQNGDSKLSPEKATSLPKFNQVFGKQIYQDKTNEIDAENLPDNSESPEDNVSLEQLSDISNPPMLIRKTNPTQPTHVQPNLVQQIKHTIGPMNIQTMHGGVIYTRQIPVNIGNGQTINLITVPSTELVDDSAQKQQSDGKFGNQEGDPPIIKIVPTNQPAVTPNTSTDDNNGSIRSNNDANPQLNPQPQPVLTQMRIKLPMLSKAPQMVGGTRVVRPSFFQIQRNVIGGANQQVYQQLVLTAAPPLGQSIRVPNPAQKPKTAPETQSSPESQMSSSTLEQLREFDMVLEQVKERSTVQPGSSSSNSFTKLKSSPDTTDSPTASTSTQESPTQVLYSVGNTQPLSMVNYVNRKSTITSTTASSFVRSPDSTGTVESPSSSTHSHLPHTVTSDSCASSSCASEAAAATAVQSKPKKKKPKPSTSNSNPFNIKNTPKPSSQKPLEDEQTTQRILYILAEYKEQVENSPDKDKPAPRRRNNPAAPNAGSSKRKKSSSGSRRRDMSPVLGEDSCRTMGSEDSSCGTSLGECNECLETHSPEESPKKVVRRLTFDQETTVTQARTTTTTTTTTTPVPQRNVIVTDGQAFAVRGATGKPATTVLMPANYLLPVSMVKGGQQIAIVTNRGPKLLVGAGEGGTGGALLFQRLIGPGGLKPVLARPGVRHIRLPTAALHNLQTFNIATPAANVQPPDSTASPAPAPTPPDLVDTRAMSSPWPDRDAGEIKPERGNSSPEGSEPWNLPSSSIADDYGYEEIVRTDNMDRTVLDAIPDRYSPDLEAQRIFDKMFDSDSKKSMYDSRCGYDIDASDDDKGYQVVHRKDGRHTTRLTHVSAAALRHKYAILEHELRLQKSLSEECEDLGVDSPSASDLFPEAELLFAPSPAHEQTIDQCHTPQPIIQQGIPQPDLEDQIATDQLLTHRERHDELDINLDDVGEIVTVGEDGMTTIPLDHEEFARSHPNTTFHSEPEDGEVPPFTIAQGVKGRQITFQSRGGPGAVVLAPQTTVISQATVKFADMDNMIHAIPTPHHNIPSVLKETDALTKFDRLLNESRDLNISNTTSAIVHSTGNGTQVIRRVQYERRDSRYLVEEDAMIAGDVQKDDDTERHPELFWDQSRPERKAFDFSSDSDKCCKSPYDETNSDSSGIGAHTRLDSVIKAARTERRRSDGSSADDSHPPLRTYPAKRTHHDSDRSVTGKTRATDRCHEGRDESRRRASNRGVVKRGCHCCNGAAPPKPKKSRPKKTDYPH